MKEVIIKIKKQSKVNENGETVSEYLLMAQDNEGKITPPHQDGQGSVAGIRPAHQRICGKRTEGRRRAMNDAREECSGLHYYINGLENLTQFLQVVEEISAETGMSDWVMTHRGIRMAYCWQDAKAVIKGAMSEETYIVRNRLPEGFPHKE